MSMLVAYDSSVDALYIYLQPDPTVARSEVIDESRTVDLDARGDVVGIEVLSASGGFKVDDIIKRFQLEPMTEELEQAAREFAATAQL